jgi:hypothetical protein
MDAEAILQAFHFRHICIATINDSKVVHAVLETSPCPDRIPESRFQLFQSFIDQTIQVLAHCNSAWVNRHCDVSQLSPDPEGSAG